MILLQTKALSKSFGTERIFENVNTVIGEKEKIGLVGPNGAGKTTLLNCLTGKEPFDGGEVVLADAVTVGCLEQIPEYPPEVTLFEAIIDMFADILALRDKLKELAEAMSGQEGSALEQTMARYARITEEYERSGGFACEAMTRRVANGLGFSERDLERKVAEFSGGERTKVGLARLLVRRPELLLLDEPTNHLDLAAVEWLESFLKSYPGALLVISHDRYFLDEVTQKTLELDDLRLTSYAGNYSRYLLLKEENTLTQTRAYEKQRRLIAATEEYIERYRAGIKSRQARGRQSRLERLQVLDKPTTASRIHIGKEASKAAGSANVVLEVKDLAMSFEAGPSADAGTSSEVSKLWDGLSFRIARNEKVALIGKNGAGKSTLFKIIASELMPVKGSVKIGARVRVGYFDQEHRSLTSHNSVLDEVQNGSAPDGSTLTPAEARDVLGSFLFRGDDVFKLIRDLSGGEKGRLAFLKLILAKPNLLLLDEPTNHLDIASRQVIEEYLLRFEGTVLVISHDRYFLDKITERTLELEGAGLADHPGNYSYCRESKARREKTAVQEAAEVAGKGQAAQGRHEKNKADEKNKAKPKINKAQTRVKIAALEKDIELYEERLAEVASLLADGASYQEEATAKGLLAEYKELEEKIPAAYAEWERFHELLAGG